MNHGVEGGLPGLSLPLGLLGSHGKGRREVRECVGAATCVRGEVEEGDEVEGTNEIWLSHFNTYKGIRKTLENNGAACHDKLVKISEGQ